MARFKDVYAPPGMPTHPVYCGPRWKHRIVTVDSGDEQVNPVWEHALQKYSMPECIRDFASYCAVRNHWYAMKGPTHTWPFRDPLDYSSIDHMYHPDDPTPDISAYDQIIGYGDGATTEFQLIRNYASGDETHARPIYLPLAGFVIYAIDGGPEQNALAAPSPGADCTVTRPGGILTFADPPDEGAVITAGYFFDVEVRFENDEAFEGIFQGPNAGGYASINLVEVRHCTDGE